MTKKISWRLKTLPTTEEIQSLVKDGILTKDEAREILFSQEDEKSRSTASLETEIKFLRELVTTLSGNRSQIVTAFEKVYIPYKKYDWYQPYLAWYAGGLDTSSGLSTNALNASYTITGTGGTGSITTYVPSKNVGDFSQIKTY